MYKQIVYMYAHMTTQLSLNNTTLSVSQDEFNKKSIDEKWELFRTVLIENQYLKTEIGKFALVNSMLLNENMELKNKIDALFKELQDQNKLKEHIERLEKENIEMKENIKKQDEHIARQDVRINVLEEENGKLHEHIKRQDDAISELKKDNAELKKDNAELKKDNAELKKDNAELKKDNKKLHSRLDRIEARHMYNRFVIAIQDINRLDKLETLLPASDSNTLKKLKDNRISDCHFLDDSDSTALKNDKRTVLFDKIQTMSEDVVKMFNKNYPNLLSSVIPYIAPIKTTPSDDVVVEVEEWLDYI